MAASGGEALICVRDGGDGHDPGAHPGLFDRVFRASAPHEGTVGRGLGLYIARALIEASGGRMWAARTAEGGWEIGAALPAAAAGGRAS